MKKDMSHLHDMEELVNSIEDEQVKDYMKEAMSCYMASAYRACIVLTYIALFDDIVKKLGELGKVNKKAKKIYDEATKKINDQDVFESYVIDQLKSNSLLPALDATFLDTLRTLRNKSAHTSGHHASAEEARYIFFESINRFLSKPILSTTQLVDEILARLNEKHFFPSSDITKIAGVVKKELSNIHYEAFPYLINKFLEKTQNTNTDISRNSGFFLTGLAYSKDENVSEYLKKYIIDKKCSDSKFSSLVLRIISADGALLKELEAVTYDRLRSVVSERVENVDPSLEHTRFGHPSSVFKSILEGCGEEFLIKEFGDQLTEYFKKDVFCGYFLSSVEGCSKVIEIYLEEASKKAGSADFNTANHFSRNIKDVDAYLAKCLLGEQLFLLLAHIFSAAERGAWGAQALRNSKFSSIPLIKESVFSYLVSEPESAKELYKEVVGDDESFDEAVEEYFSDEEA